jgi:hypothetical protein
MVADSLVLTRTVSSGEWNRSAGKCTASTVASKEFPTVLRKPFTNFTKRLSQKKGCR